MPDNIVNFFDDELESLLDDTEQAVFHAGHRLQRQSRLYVPDLDTADSIKVYNLSSRDRAPTSYVRILHPNEVKLTDEYDTELLERLAPARRAGLPRIHSEQDWILVQRKVKMQAYRKGSERIYFGEVRGARSPLYKTKPNVPTIPFFEMAERIADDIPRSVEK